MGVKIERERREGMKGVKRNGTERVRNKRKEKRMKNGKGKENLTKKREEGRRERYNVKNHKCTRDESEWKRYGDTERRLKGGGRRML